MIVDALRRHAQQTPNRRAELDRFFSEADALLNKPVAWVIPGDNNAREDGSIDAMAWEAGEFTRPLYAVTSTERGIDLDNPDSHNLLHGRRPYLSSTERGEANACAACKQPHIDGCWGGSLADYSRCPNAIAALSSNERQEPKP
jgi:hypothetical protein